MALAEATTPKYGIRYPTAQTTLDQLPTALQHTSTDLDNAFDNALQRVVEAATNPAKGGWVEVDIQLKANVIRGGFANRIARQGALVVVAFSLVKTSGPIADYETVAVMPPGFRPPFGSIMSGGAVTAPNVGWRAGAFYIETNGNVNLFPSGVTGVNELAGSATFWLP